MQPLIEILQAKEKRQAIRKQLANEGFATISLNFNIPGYPKSNPDIEAAIKRVKLQLLNYLIASRIAVDESKIVYQLDDAGSICFYPLLTNQIELKSIKTQLEGFEASHPLGRLLDVDLFDLKGYPVSSGKAKACFICSEKPAIQCMREQNHTYDELRAYIDTKTQQFLAEDAKERISKKLVALATQSILMEVSLPDKPGLVCPASQGSHSDMNYLTFIQSTAAINTYFTTLAAFGYDWDGVKTQKIILDLRMIGLQMEKDMFEATQGVNTQKGIIFLMGFSLFAAAYVIKKEGVFEVDSFCKVLSLLNQNIVSKELGNGWNKNASNGELCFNKHGAAVAGGIRQEIEQGLPTVFEVALPFMNQLFPDKLKVENQHDTQTKLLRILLKIMSVNNDTNILHRSNLQTLNELKEFARQADEFAEISYLLDYCKAKNISPGGSADLLAITLFIYQMLNDKVFV